MQTTIFFLCMIIVFGIPAWGVDLPSCEYVQSHPNERFAVTELLKEEVQEISLDTEVLLHRNLELFRARKLSHGGHDLWAADVMQHFYEDAARNMSENAANLRVRSARIQSLLACMSEN